jgi:2-polyprenyl-3-methyl-5-hydroxy-6-metoxy-1,4-benzoquinol methylase
MPENTLNRFSSLSRSHAKERLDIGEYSYSDYAQSLRELEWINTVTGGYRPTLQALSYFLKKAKKENEPLHVLDIGYGFGDTLRAIRAWARKSDFKIQLEGIDLNPWAGELAEAQTPSSLDIQYHVGNIFEFSGSKYDVIINSLFMHHLNDLEIQRVMKWMTAHSRLGWFINDLHRHPISYYGAKLGTRIFNLGEIVKYDAPLSVARSFTMDEWQIYLSWCELSLAKSQIRWHWPFRIGVRYEL